MSYVALRYTAIPVEVEAVRFDGMVSSIMPFADDTMLPAAISDDPSNPGVPTILVATSRGNVMVPYARVWPGEWIVRTPSGFEIYNNDEFCRRFKPSED